MPDGRKLDRFLGGLDFLVYRYYEASAMVQMLPVWIRFLRKLDLVSEEQATITLRRVQGVYQDLLKFVEAEVADTQVALELRNWFGGSM